MSDRAGAARQLALDLPARPALGREDFFVSEANRLAVAQIEGWRNWPAGRLALIGPEGSGKTHLTQVWAGMSGARVVPAATLTEAAVPELTEAGAVAVEDADRMGPAPERALFHLYNGLGESGGALLLTGREAPSRWPVALPDLASRVQAAPVARLDPPDDLLFQALVVKLFADRQTPIRATVPPYLARRLDRSFAALEAAVAEIDRAALAARAEITRDFAADVLRRRAES